ncbi:hypothetical protein [Georgenia sp. SUBG003]|uniref:hypothetical protein n=1 Tax=Georgenia sp. SUBG003 TaxID=1497974 RepID=UPI003AB2F149
MGVYTGELLPPEQQLELTSLISTRTAQPIDRTSPADPGGFGLGVSQGTHEKFGTLWLYLGGTFGFRVLHMYFPDSGVVLALGLNSQPDQDRIIVLAGSVYDTLASHGLIRPHTAMGDGTTAGSRTRDGTLQRPQVLVQAPGPSAEEVSAGRR